MLELPRGLPGTIPTLAEDYARPGDAKLLYRHYSNSENAEQLGFYGAEAAAEQGYGWQYTYLFFRNQDEAERSASTRTSSTRSPAGSRNSNFPNGKRTWKTRAAPTAPIAKRLEGYEELGRDLGIRVRQAAIVTGPNGTETLQDGPSLGQIERAIEAVR